MKATLIEKIFVQGVGFLQGILLARLLCPEDFGLVAMLGIFLAVGTMFAEGGLGAAYVVYGGGTGKVFRWNVGMAIGVYALLAIASPWIAAFYHQPILRELTWVMGLSIVLNAASVVGSARLQREQKFGKIALVNGAATICATITGVGMAWMGLGVWAIAGVGIVYAAVRLVGIAWGRCEKRERCERSDDVWREMLRYGWKNTLSALVHTVYFNSYQLIIGKMLSPAAVGLFNRGQRWAMLPGEVVNDSVSRVALPSLAKGEASVKVRSMSVEWWKVNLLLLWPGLVVLWIWAEEIVGLVLGAQWVECVPYLRILIVGALFTPISNVMLCKIRAGGRMNLLLLTDVIKKPIQIVGLIIGAFFGIDGLCWAVVAGEIMEAIVDSVVVWRGV